MGGQSEAADLVARVRAALDSGVWPGANASSSCSAWCSSPDDCSRRCRHPRARRLHPVRALWRSARVPRSCLVGSSERPVEVADRGVNRVPSSLRRWRFPVRMSFLVCFSESGLRPRADSESSFPRSSYLSHKLSVFCRMGSHPSGWRVKPRLSDPRRRWQRGRDRRVLHPLGRQCTRRHCDAYGRHRRHAGFGSDDGRARSRRALVP